VPCLPVDLPRRTDMLAGATMYAPAALPRWLKELPRGRPISQPRRTQGSDASGALSDLQSRLWTIPADRMKAGREHRVPLSEDAMTLLSRLKREGDRVFPVSNMAMLMLLRRMGRGDLTTHGFRSTFSDWCAEQTNFPSEVREMALAHAVGDKVEAAYRRGDLFEKRRQLAEAWAQYCEGEEPAESKVVRLAGRAG
jgi:hypothetical protein